MKYQIRITSAVVAAVMLLASCGGGDSSGRTKNSALCYATQEEKDAAVQAARDAFDSAMGGGAPGDSQSDTTVPTTEDSVAETEDSGTDESPSDTVLMESSPADGGGYRRPAVRAASSGDTTIPNPMGDGEFTPEQQQLQMDLKNAEAQPLCGEEGAGETAEERSCEVTLAEPPMADASPGTSTCEEVVVEVANMDDPSAIQWNALVNGEIVYSDTWDSVSEATKVVSFTYVPASGGGEGEGDGDAADILCEITISGEIGNVSVTDDCPDGQGWISGSDAGDTWLLVLDGATPEDSSAILAQGPVDMSTLTPEQPIVIPVTYQFDGGQQNEEEISVSDFEFNGVFEGYKYYFHSPVDGSDTNIYMTTGASCEEAPFSINWYVSNGVSYEPSSVDDGYNEEGVCEYGYSGTYSEDYIFFLESNDAVSWGANVNFTEVPESDLDGEEIKTPFEYTFESASVRYSFELTEVTVVRITGNTFMSCEGRSQIVPDPEMTLYEGFGSDLDQIAYADNNYSDSDGNCSAAEIYEELEPGLYVLDVINEDYDNPTERGTITIQSSVELVEVVRDWSQINLRKESVNPPKVFDVTIPEGGALFVATADSLNSDEQCETAGDDDNPLTYVDPYIILINKSTGAMVYSDDSGENIGLPCYSSYLELEVDGGEYLFIATTYALADNDGDYTDGEIAGTYNLEFGVSGSDVPEEVVIEESTEPAPQVEIPAPPALPVGQLVEPGSKGTVQIADGVSSMVCNSTCIEELFAAVDPSVNTLQVAIGKNTVELKRNSKKAVVAVEAGSRSVNVVAVSDTGVETKVLTGQVQIGEPEVTVGANQSDSGSAFNWMILVIIGLIVVAGAGVAVSRRKKTV